MHPVLLLLLLTIAIVAAIYGLSMLGVTILLKIYEKKRP